MPDTSSPAISTRFALALGLITLLGPASIDMYLPSIPAMTENLEAPYASLQLTITVFLLAQGVGQLVFGPVIDAYGRRKPLLAALAAFIAASVWCATAQSLDGLLLARFVQGLATSLALVTAMSSVRDVAQGAQAARLFAFLMTIQGLGPVLAPALGGWIGANFGWRAIFLTLGGLGLLVLVNSLVNLSETLAPEKRSSLKFGAVARSYAAILSDGRFLTPALALASAFFFLFSYVGGASSAYQLGYGLAPETFGYVFGLTGLAVLLGALACAKLADRCKVEKLARVGALLMLLGAGIGLVSAIADLGLPGVVLGMFVALAGLGVAEASLMTVALSTRETAMGASAAILGAFPLAAGALATPLAALAAEIGSVEWLGFLTASGLVTTGLTWISARRAARSG